MRCCMVSGLSIHFRWQTTLPENKLCQLGRRTEDALFPFSWTDSGTVGVRIIATLTLEIITFLSDILHK